MTRDEAIKKIVGGAELSRSEVVHFRAGATAFVDNLAALGLLKLDEPKSIKDRTREAFVCSKWNPECAADLPLLLERVGLKIVEA